MRVVGDGYPCGPCSLPLKCACGKILTDDNVVNESCDGECEVCDYCGNTKCPNCGQHVCCGGCI